MLQPSLSKDSLSRLLNEEQFHSVVHTDGPLLILAGAGSGKTRVITYKISYLMQNGVTPSKILAVTFTNKAAREMKERVNSLTKGNKKGLIITTFHSLGLRILEKEITVLGYRSKFSIYDDKDCLKLLKDVLQELKIPEESYDPYDLTFKISDIKMNMKKNFEDPVIYDIYEKYQSYLYTYNALDFNDLIKLPLEIFLQHPEVLAKYQNRWKYILVDEYQDTSDMQYNLIRLLAGKHKNISVVGDDDQSIYSWRGANISNITNFEEDFHPIREIKLEQNYRCSGNILKAANAVISKNTSRKDKKLWTDGEHGEPINIYVAEDEESEANFVFYMLDRLVNKGYKYKDFGILFRQNSQSRPFEEKFREKSIPYKVIGAMNFFERPEIRDILSYMRFLANQDDEVSLTRIINMPKRGIGNATIMSLMEYSKENNIPIYQSIRIFISNGIMGERVTSYLKDFYDLIEEFREMIFKPKNIAKTITKLVDAIDYKSKLASELKNLKKISYRLQNINQLVQSISKYENNPDHHNPNIYEYLQMISLNSKDDNEKDDNQVNLLTIHSAKGLEYPIVFLVGVEEGLIPSQKTIEETETDEEERRLFYVALTRAKEHLFISYPTKRMKFNETLEKAPSPFLTDIPEDIIEYVDLEEKLSKENPLELLLKKWNNNS